MSSFSTLSILATLVLLCPDGMATPLPKSNEATATADQTTADQTTVVEAIDKAAALWEASCAAPNGQDCFVIREIARKHSCQPTVWELKPTRRNRRKAQRAQSQLQTALASVASERVQPLEGDTAAAVARARFLIAEAMFEKLASINSPRGLNFSYENRKRRQKSEKRFLDFFQRAMNDFTAVAAAYQDVLAVPQGPRSNPWRALATARSARTSWLLASQLYSIEIPVDVRTGNFVPEAKAAFCDALADKARPLESQAQNAADLCISLEQATPDSPLHAECTAMKTPLSP